MLNPCSLLPTRGCEAGGPCCYTPTNLILLLIQWIDDKYPFTTATLQPPDTTGVPHESNAGADLGSRHLSQQHHRSLDRAEICTHITLV